jgi:hypothetical protein
MLLLDMMRNEIKVLIFYHEGMHSIHCWNKFLYIIGAHFYILLEQLSMHFYTLLCNVRTLLTYIVGTISVHFYTVILEDAA